MIDPVINKDLQRLLRDWRLGKMVMNKKCKLCDDHNLSRSHLVECAKIDAQLKTKFSGLFEEWNVDLREDVYFVNFLLNKAERLWQEDRKIGDTCKEVLHQCGIIISKIVTDVATGNYSYSKMWTEADRDLVDQSSKQKSN
jgi:hypothetical protein